MCPHRALFSTTTLLSAYCPPAGSEGANALLGLILPYLRSVQAGANIAAGECQIPGLHSILH